VTDLHVKVQQLEQEIASCEREARDHEEQARAKRLRRSEAKIELAAVVEQVHKALAQQRLADTAAAAEQARAQAEAAQQAAVRATGDAADILAQLKAKEARLDELLQRFDVKDPADVGRLSE
jgi:hypothetical protein